MTAFGLSGLAPGLSAHTVWGAPEPLERQSTDGLRYLAAVERDRTRLTGWVALVVGGGVALAFGRRFL